MSRVCWIDQPQQPDVPKLKKHLITDAIFDGRWLAQMGPAQALDYLEKVRDQLGGSPGAFFCAQGSDSLGAWPSWRTTTGPEWADWVYDTFQNHIAPGTAGAFPVVHLNPECDDVTWQMTMMKRWRMRSPRRYTVWSPVGHKAPIFKAVAGQIVQHNIIVAPQCYVGNMERIESANEVLAWAQIGIPVTKIQPFLDGATLGHWWGEVGGAIVFSQNRLP